MYTYDIWKITRPTLCYLSVKLFFMSAAIRTVFVDIPISEDTFLSDFLGELNTWRYHSQQK